MEFLNVPLNIVNQCSKRAVINFKQMKGLVSKEAVVLRRWEGIAGTLVLTTELKT